MACSLILADQALSGHAIQNRLSSFESGLGGSLVTGELSVGEINERLGLSQSALSQHLAVLRRDELVATRKVGQTVYYSLKSEEVQAIIGVLHSFYCRTV